jgi:hypothetical protein
MTMAAAAVVAATACGGGGGGPAAPPTPVLSVGGDYTIAVALAENGCGDVTVLPLPTRVEHAPGALSFRLVHGPGTYAGTLQADGRFATAPLAFADGASTQTVTISGRFLPGGLEATAAVSAVFPPAAPCAYSVRWTGTKVGAPNVIP